MLADGECVDHASHLRPDAVTGDAGEDRKSRQCILRGPMHRERHQLRHVRNSVLFDEGARFEAIDGNRTAGGTEESQQKREDGALPRTVGSGDTEHFSLCDVERHVLHRVHAAAEERAVGLGNTSQCNQGPILGSEGVSDVPLMYAWRQRRMRNSPASALPRTKLSASAVEIRMPVSDRPRRASLCMNSCTDFAACVLESRIWSTISSQLPSERRPSRPITLGPAPASFCWLKSARSAPNSSSWPLASCCTSLFAACSISPSMSSIASGSPPSSLRRSSHGLSAGSSSLNRYVLFLSSISRQMPSSSQWSSGPVRSR